VVLVSTVARKHALAFVQDRGLDNVPIISDPERSILGVLNPVFKPRAYLFSTDGTLKWIQRDPDLAQRNLGSDDAFRASLAGNHQ
jgi:hypothetical protein